MIDDILAGDAMTEAHLRMLVEKIYVQETDRKLSLNIQIKAPEERPDPSAKRNGFAMRTSIRLSLKMQTGNRFKLC